MGKSKHWVLLSNTMDVSLLRNRIMKKAEGGEEPFDLQK